MTLNVDIIDMRIKKIEEQYKADIQQQLNTTKQNEHFLMAAAFVLYSYPRFLPYATYFLAMLTGEQLLKLLSMTLEGLNHRQFTPVKLAFEKSHKQLYALAVNQLEAALYKMYNDYETMSLQRLAATFRRGDLLEVI